MQGGYLGAENQAICVQIVDASHFTWGFDNAAPLYRVQVQAAAGAASPNLITMLTTPKDQAHWPLAGQVVEILPWSALLPNGEKTAEVTGFLATVQSSYDPDLKQFTIAPVLPPGFGVAWKNRSDIGTSAPTSIPTAEFFYLRVWNRGSDPAPTAAIPIGTGVPLGNTGLKVTFTGTQRAGDFWIIAARPESPDVVVPWELTGPNGRAAHGIRRWFAPLGIIRWTPGASVPGTVVDDCRPTFPPLTRLGGCCTCTVGDNVSSHGQFSTIQEAINHLPPEGGKVCVLPGTFFENLEMKDLRSVTIAGCGVRSCIVSPAPARGATAKPVIHIQGGRHVTLDSLGIEAGDHGPGVVIEGADPTFSKELRLISATLCDLFVAATDLSPEEMSKILETQFASLDPQRADALAGLQTIHAIRAALSAREEKRLASKYGADSPRVAAQAARTRADRELLGALAFETDLARTEPPAVEKEGYVFHGFVRQQDGRAAPRLTVALYDRAGIAIREFGYGCTDERGYFLLRYEPRPARKGTVTAELAAPGGAARASAEPSATFIYVLNARKDILEIEKEPLHPRQGAIDFRLIVLGSEPAPCAPPPPVRAAAR